MRSLRVRIYRTDEFFRSFWAAPPRVREKLLYDLPRILTLGRQRTFDPHLRARIVDDWFLHFRYPEADEEYDPSSYILLRIAREFL